MYTGPLMDYVCSINVPVLIKHTSVIYGYDLNTCITSQHKHGLHTNYRVMTVLLMYDCRSSIVAVLD